MPILLLKILFFRQLNSLTDNESILVISLKAKEGRDADSGYARIKSHKIMVPTRICDDRIKTRITSIILLLIMAFMLAMPVVAFANSTPSTSSDGTDILSTVTNASSAGSAVDNLQTSAQTAGNSFIKFLRNTAIIIAVIMFVVVAYSLLFSPNVKTIGDAKGRIGALVMAIAISVLAEQIVGTLLSWFGFNVGH